MKKFLMSLVIILIIPTLSHAEKSYFLACKEGTMVNTIYKQKSRNFKRGDIFEIPTQALYKQGDKILNNDPRGICWADTGDTKCPLVVHYGNSSGAYQHGYADLGAGIWFKTEGSIPIKSNAAGKLLNMFGGLVGGTKDENFENYLDKEYVDVMCSEHPTKFEVAGNAFTDIKKEKGEFIANKLEEIRLQKIASDEKARKDQEEKSHQLEQERATVQKNRKIKTDSASTSPQDTTSKGNTIIGAFGIKFGEDMRPYMTGARSNYSMPVIGLENFAKDRFSLIPLKPPMNLTEIFPDTRSVSLAGLRDDEDRVIVLVLNGNTGSWGDCGQINSIKAVREILREKYKITKPQGQYNNWEEEYGDSEGNSIKLHCSSGEYSIKYTSKLHAEYIEILEYRKQKQQDDIKKSLKNSGM